MLTMRLAPGNETRSGGLGKGLQEHFIYEYDPTPFNAELPWPMYGTHARSMPDYKAMGIRGFLF